MIRVKMLKTAAGPSGVKMVGSIVPVSDDEALELVEAGAAAFVDAKVTALPPEAAVRKAPENAMRPRARARKGE